jgi:putative Mn2+ efflux pump MntP
MIAVIAVTSATIGVLAAVMSGWVITYLWQWFVMPVFDIRSISIVEAIGISMIASFLTYQYQASRQKEKDNRTTEEHIIEMLQYGIFRPLGVLGGAYIVHLFL